MSEKEIQAAHELLATKAFQALPERIAHRMHHRLVELAACPRPPGTTPERAEEAGARRGKLDERLRQARIERTERWEKSPEGTTSAHTLIKDAVRLPLESATLINLIDLLGLGPSVDPVSIGPSTAVALAGGGSKGSFEVGALAFLTKRLTENKIDYVCGTSTGALNALALSAGGVTNGTRTLIKIYLGLLGSSGMYVYDWRLRNVDAYLRAGFDTSLASVLSGSGSGTDLNPDEILVYDRWWVRAVTWGVPAIGQIIGTFILWQATDELETKLFYLQLITQLLQDAQSIYTLDPVRGLITDNIVLNNVGQIPLRMAMVDLESGKLHYMNENGELLIGAAAPSAPGYEGLWTLNGTKPQNLTNGAIASASIPGAFPPQQLDVSAAVGGHFVDGGVREMIPLTAAKQLGVQRIIGILASPRDIARVVVGTPTMSQTLGRSLDILTNEVATNEHNPPSTFCDNVERILIWPDVIVHDTMIVDPGLLRINMAYGYMRSHDMYLGQTGQLNVDGLALLLGYMATEALTALRVEAHERELVIFHGWDPAGVWFDKPQVDALRRVKQQILEMAEARFLLMGESRDSLPLQLDGGAGVRTELRESWEKWERHPPVYEQVLANFDLWSPLPIARDSSGNRVFEATGSVPPRPTTTLF